MGCRARRTLGFKVSLNARYRGGTFPLRYLVKLAAVRSDKFTTAVSNWGVFLVVMAKTTNQNNPNIGVNEAQHEGR